MADIFTKSDAANLLGGKYVIFLGDSNMRALYKDVVYLLNCNALIGATELKKKLEPSFMGDKLLEGDKLTRGRDYVEVRQFKTKKFFMEYYFITRCYNKYIEKIASKVKTKKMPAPDVIFMNSVLWDVTRWGPDGVSKFKDNMVKLMKLWKSSLPEETLFVWTTAPPVSQHCYGGTLIKQIEFLRHTLRFEVMEANMFARDVVGVHGFHVLDLHYYFRTQLILRAKDGVHWLAPAVRHMTNLLLTHVALSFDHPLPGNFQGPLLDEMKELMELPDEESLPVALPRLPLSLVLKDSGLPTASPQMTAIVKSPLCKPPISKNARKRWKKKTRQIKSDEKENAPRSCAVPRLITHERRTLLPLPYEMQFDRQQPPVLNVDGLINFASSSSSLNYEASPEIYFAENKKPVRNRGIRKGEALFAQRYKEEENTLMLSATFQQGRDAYDGALKFGSSSSACVNVTNYENRNPVRNIGIRKAAALLTQHYKDEENALIQVIEEENALIQVIEDEMAPFLQARDNRVSSETLEDQWWSDSYISPRSSSHPLQYCRSRYSRRAMPY